MFKAFQEKTVNCYIKHLHQSLKINVVDHYIIAIRVYSNGLHCRPRASTPLVDVESVEKICFWLDIIAESKKNHSMKSIFKKKLYYFYFLYVYFYFAFLPLKKSVMLSFNLNFLEFKKIISKVYGFFSIHVWMTKVYFWS